MTDLPDIHSPTFACSCGPENKQECADVLLWAYKTLGPDTDASNFLTRLVYHLSGYYNASITNIPNDPGGWSAVIAESYPKEAPDALLTYIQCDQVEDGLAFTLLAFVNKYGPRRESQFVGEDDDAEENVQAPTPSPVPDVPS